MRTVRRHLLLVVCAWLACQVVAVTATPLLLAGDDLCTCPGAIPGAACPMHHPHHDPSECVLQNAAPAASTALASFLGGLGLVAPVHTTSAIFDLVEPIAPTSESLIVRADRPDSPPPRR